MSKDRSEEIKEKMAEMGMLLSKLEGLIKVYRSLEEGIIRAKIGIEKEGSTVKVKLLNPEMLYDLIEEFEFPQSTTINDMVEKILTSDRLKSRVTEETADSLLRLANVVLELFKTMNTHVDEDAGNQ